MRRGGRIVQSRLESQRPPRLEHRLDRVFHRCRRWRLQTAGDYAGGSRMGYGERRYQMEQRRKCKTAVRFRQVDAGHLASLRGVRKRAEGRRQMEDDDYPQSRQLQVQSGRMADSGASRFQFRRNACVQMTRAQVVARSEYRHDLRGERVGVKMHKGIDDGEVEMWTFHVVLSFFKAKSPAFAAGLLSGCLCSV